MIIPSASLKKAGYDPSGSGDKMLRGKFYPAEGISARSQGVQDLIDLMSSRVRAGMDRCLEDAHLYWAIDEAMQAPLRQLGITLARHAANANEEAVPNATELLQHWGITHMLSPSVDPGTGKPRLDGAGRKVMALDLPVFVNVFFPAVMAYVHAKWANLFTAFDQYPFYKYSPAIPTPENKAKCDIITSWMATQTARMGYRADERQCFLQAIKYGWCLTAPTEPFFRQYVDDGGKKKLVREGIRSDIPHPTESFYDGAHRPSSINFDNGCNYFGWWRLHRYGEVVNDKSLWIPDDKTLTMSTGIPAMFASSAWQSYRHLYPTAMRWPSTPAGSINIDNRQNRAFDYTTNNYDNAMAVCRTFHRIVPKDWDLFDYDEPLWIRSVTAFDREPLKVEPMQYTPGAMYLYDFDQNSSVGSGVAVQALPFQDAISNLLTQYILSIRRNLVNLVFYNRDGQLDDVVRRLESLGQKFYTQLNFQGVSFRALEAQGLAVDRLFSQVSFPIVPTTEALQGIQTLLNIMDRTLRFSSQDFGAQGSHQQSATEMARIGASVKTGQEHTATFFEDAINRRQEMLYEGNMVHGDDEVVGEVANTLGIDPAAVAMLGFNVEAGESATRSYGVVGPKSALDSAVFASFQQGSKRPSDIMLAQTMLQTMQVVFNSKPLLELAGVETVADWWNTVATYAGLPTNQRLRVGNGAAAPGVITDQMLQQIQQVVLETIQQILPEQLNQLGQAMRAEALEPLRQEVAAAIAEHSKRISRVEGGAGLPPSQNAIIPEP